MGGGKERRKKKEKRKKKKEKTAKEKPHHPHFCFRVPRLGFLEIVGVTLLYNKGTRVVGTAYSTVLYRWFDGGDKSKIEVREIWDVLDFSALCRVFRGN